MKQMNKLKHRVNKVIAINEDGNGLKKKPSYEKVRREEVEMNKNTF